MATRTVTVRLRADINQYTRGMRQAADNTSRLAGAGATVGTALVTGFAIAAASAAKFDKALSNVRAVTGASTKEMGQLRAAALEAGKSTSFSATEAANAEAELARAGISVANITGGALKGSLALAASGQLDLAEAATISAQAMNTFGLKGRDVGHIADVLSAGANKSAADVHGLGEALRMGGLLAHQTGLSIEETVGTLSAFADHALIGSDAGTSLKTMLQRLVPQSDEAKAAMDKIGFSAYDSQGKFVGLTELAGRMKTSFSKLTPEARNAAMATIFGSDAVRSATILYELGSKGIDKYTKSVDDQGAAGRMAAIQTDNLIGDLERLRGAIEVALIEGGSAANGALRGMTQWITKLVDAYNDLPPELQRSITMFSGVSGAVLLVASGILLLLPRIQATRVALTAMGVTAARTRAVMLGLGRMTNVVLTLAAIGYGVSKAVGAFQDAPPNINKMKAAMVDFAQSGKVTGEAARAFGADLDGVGDAAARIAHPSGLKRTKDFFSTFDPFNGTDLDRARDKIKAIDESLTELVTGGHADVAAENFQAYAKAAEESGTSTEKFRTLLPGYSDALLTAATDGKLAKDSQAALGEETGITADQMQDQRSEAEKLSDALRTLNGSAISAAEKEIGFRQSLADLSDAAKENGRSLDVTSEKGRKVKSAFLDAAQAAMDHAQAVAEQTNSQAAGQKVLETDISLLRKQMKAANFSSDAIDALTSAFLKLPDSKTPTVDVKTRGAISGLDEVRKRLAGTKDRTVTVNALTKEARAQLEALGFKIKNTKGKKLSITVPTGSQRAAVDALKRAIDALRDKSVKLTTTQVFKTVRESGGTNQGAKNFYETQRASGGIIQRFAGGGDVQVIPFGGPISGPGTGTSDSIPALVSNGEYVIKAASVRKYGLAMFDRLNAGRYAGGGLAGGFTYTPTGQAVLGGPTDAKSRYEGEIEDLKKALADLSAAMKKASAGTTAYKDAQKKETATRRENARKVAQAEDNLNRVRKGHHTATQLRAAEQRLSNARRAAAKSNDAAAARTKKAGDATKANSKDVAAARKRVNAADAELGLKKGAKAPTSFNLNAYITQLDESVSVTQKWRKNLNKIGARGGKELQSMLEGMGEEGYALVNSLAGASDKQFKHIVAQLQKTGDLAKATLSDFNKQLTASTKEGQQFSADLQKLASQGFGDLAQALAAQGDSSAMALAHEAAGSPISAAAANAAVKQNQATLTGEDLTNSLVLLSTLRSKAGSGYAELLGAGLDMTTIKALVPRMMAQINALPASYKSKFLGQWAGQNGGVAMARGGILTRPSLVLGGEAGVPESWIPHNGSPRSRQLLAATAGRMGYGLIPASRYAYLSHGQGGGAHRSERNISLTLNGAKQTSGEQAMDVARHLQHIG